MYSDIEGLPTLASSLRWPAGEAKPPGVRWSSFQGKTRECRSTASAGARVGECDGSTQRAGHCHNCTTGCVDLAAHLSNNAGSERKFLIAPSVEFA